MPSTGPEKVEDSRRVRFRFGSEALLYCTKSNFVDETKT